MLQMSKKIELMSLCKLYLQKKKKQYIYIA